jgi:alanine racemase
MATIQINKENFFHNLNQIVLKVGSVDKVAVVLKDNAYGHGLEIMAALSQEFGITQAVVITTKEATKIKKYFQHILVLNGIPFKDEKLSFAITDMRQLESLENSAQIELKVDTGMHRNGVSMEELPKALGLIRSKELNLIGVMTHNKSADVLSSERYWQQKNFDQVKQIVQEHGYDSVRFHSHNSAAILRSKQFDEDIARAGIAIYGHNELPAVYDDIVLKPVLSLWAKCASTRVLKKGQRVGYGGDFTAPREMTVSTYDLGYGDGWIRGDHSHPYITTEGLPILGRVSMDFISLGSKKEEVCIMSDAQQAAKHFGTISYEMTTMLSESIERVVV